MKGTFSLSAFVAIGCLIGCGGEESSPTIAENYSLFERGFERKPGTDKSVRMEIKNDFELNFQGRKGSIQRVGRRYKVTFAGINAGTFKAAGLGNMEGSNVTFWLEFTDSGNCILYSSNQASFFLRRGLEQSPN